MTSQDDIRKENKKDLEEKLEVAKSNIKDTVVMPKEEVERLQKENEDLKKSVVNLANFMLQLSPLLEDSGKKCISSGNTLFSVTESIRTIINSIKQPQQQK